MNISAIVKLAPLMSRRLESLTLSELSDISSEFGLGVKLTPELRSAALSLLQGKSLDTVSDMLQQPESIAQLVSLLKKGVIATATAIERNHPDYEGVNSLTISFYDPAPRVLT